MPTSTLCVYPQAAANEEFKAVKAAWDVLGNTESKAQYDGELRAAVRDGMGLGSFGGGGWDGMDRQAGSPCATWLSAFVNTVCIAGGCPETNNACRVCHWQPGRTTPPKRPKQVC